MADYSALWRTQKLEEEAWDDESGREVVRLLFRLKLRNDIWWVTTSRRAGMVPIWEVRVWWRPRDRGFHLLPAPLSPPTGAFDEYYVCDVRGTNGGRVEFRANNQPVVRTDVGVLLVPHDK